MKLIKNSIIYGLLSLSPMLSQLLLVPIYTLLFNPDEYGVLSLLLMIASMGSSISMLQLESAVFRYYFDYKTAGQESVFVTTILLGVFYLSLVWLVILLPLSSVIAQVLFGNEKYTLEVCFGCLLFPLMGVSSLLGLLLRYGDAVRTYAIMSITQSLLTVVLTLGSFYVFGSSFVAILLSQAVALSVGCVIAGFFVAPSFFVRDWNFSVFRQALQYSLPLLPGMLAAWMNQNLGRLSLATVGSLTAVGEFALGLQAASAIGIVDRGFQMAWEPYFWKVIKKKNAPFIMRAIYHAVLLLSVSISLLVILFSREIIYLFAGPVYEKSIVILMVLGPVVAIRICRSVVGLGPGLENRTYLVTGANFIALIPHIVLLLLLAKPFGPLGAAIAYAVGTLTNLCLLWYFSEQLRAFKFPVINFVIMLLLIFCMILFLNSVTLQMPVKAFIAVFIALMLICKFRRNGENIIAIVRTK